MQSSSPAAGPVAAPGHRSGGLLWHRDFRLLWMGETVSQLGNAMAAVAMPLLAVLVLRASTFLVATLTAVAYLPWLVIGLPAGAWVDRLPGRSLMIVCDLASALLYASLPLAAWLGSLTMAQILAVALLAGAANVVFTTAYQVFLPSLVQPGELLKGNAKLQASSSASVIGGPGLAGLTAGAIGAVVALAANAASFLVSAACLLAIRAAPSRQPLQGAAASAGLSRQIAEGVRYVTGDSCLRLLTLWAAAGNLCLSGYSALAVVFLVRVVGLRPVVVGLLLAASGLGGVLGALTAGRISRRHGTAGALRLTAFAGLPFALLIPLTGSGWRILLFLAGAFIAFGAVAAGAVILSSFRQATCPPHLLGRVVATMRFLLYGVYPLGALLGGLLGTWLGIRTALWIALSAAVASGVLLLSPTVRSRRELPASRLHRRYARRNNVRPLRSSDRCPERKPDELPAPHGPLDAFRYVFAERNRSRGVQPEFLAGCVGCVDEHFAGCVGCVDGDFGHSLGGTDPSGVVTRESPRSLGGPGYVPVARPGHVGAWHQANGAFAVQQCGRSQLRVLRRAEQDERR